MFIETPKNGFYLSAGSIKDTEEKDGSVYMGFWPLGDRASPVDVFYRKKTKSYYAIAYENHVRQELDASSVFAAPIVGFVITSGKVLVNRTNQYGIDFAGANPEKVVYIFADGPKFKFVLRAKQFT